MVFLRLSGSYSVDMITCSHLVNASFNCHTSDHRHWYEIIKTGRTLNLKCACLADIWKIDHNDSNVCEPFPSRQIPPKIYQWEDNHYPDVQEEYSVKALTWNQRSEILKKLPLECLGANSFFFFLRRDRRFPVQKGKKKEPTHNVPCDPTGDRIL